MAHSASAEPAKTPHLKQQLLRRRATPDSASDRPVIRTQSPDRRGKLKQENSLPYLSWDSRVRKHRRRRGRDPPLPHPRRSALRRNLPGCAPDLDTQPRLVNPCSPSQKDSLGSDDNEPWQIETIANTIVMKGSQKFGLTFFKLSVISRLERASDPR